MTIIVNGETKEYGSELTLLEMMNIVKQDIWESHPLNDGDKVELLDFVGGG